MKIISLIDNYLIKRKTSVMVNKQRKYFKDNPFFDDNPFPRIIHIETRTRCNSTCSFCMANIYDDPRDDLLMSDKLVTKIIDELSEMKYSNRISFYNNNEPFLDKRMYKIIENSRNKIPRSYLELKSNGRGLKIEMIIDVFNAGLDTLIINDYTDTGEHSKGVKKIQKELKSIRRFKGHMISYKGKYNDRIIINKRILSENLGTRAGTAPNSKELNVPITSPCFRPFEMMTISPNGTVGVCSEDFFYSTKMGDINKHTINEIWYSEKYNMFRRELINGNRNVHDACSKCDYKGFTYEMLYE